MKRAETPAWTGESQLRPVLVADLFQTRFDSAAVVGLTSLVVAAGGEVLSIALQSRTLALATLVVYGLGFAVLAWWRFAFAVMALVVAVPLITVEVGLGDVEKTLSGDKIVLALVVVAWFSCRGFGAAPVLLRITAVRCWLGFLAIVALSVLVHGPSLRELWGFAGQIVYFGLFCLALETLDSRDVDVRGLAVAVCLSGVAVATLGVVEKAYLLQGRVLPLYFKQGTMTTEYPFGSTIGHPNFLSAYLAMVLAILVALSCLPAARWRALTVAASAIVAGVLALARSIGALVGLVTAFLFTAVLALRAHDSRRRALGVIVAFLLVVCGVGWIAVTKLSASQNSIGVRVATLRIGLVAISERPLLGFGTHGYRRQSSRIEHTIFGRHLREFHAEDQPFSAHSSYLDVAVERGLPALVAFVGILSAILAAGLRGYRQARDPRHRIMMAGLLAGLLAFCVQALTENLFSDSKIAAIFWIMAAALVRMAADDAAVGVEPSA